VAGSVVAWTFPARQDLFNALRYLVQEAKSPQAAATLLERLEAAAASLRQFPERGRVVPELGLAGSSWWKAIGWCIGCVPKSRSCA